MDIIGGQLNQTLAYFIRKLKQVGQKTDTEQ